jgi:hypothetical protein
MLWMQCFVCQGQRINIILLVKLDKNATDICKTLQQVYGEETISITQPFVRVKQLQDME